MFRRKKSVGRPLKIQTEASSELQYIHGMRKIRRMDKGKVNR
jgi:hypothetical protein